jgi:hypothetical protein
MSEATIDFIDCLVARVPPLQPILREHLSDNFGEVLPHVFLGEVTRYAVAEFVRSNPPGSVERRASPELESLLVELEAGVAAGGEITELIGVSFLENLPRPDEPGGGVRDLLGPQLSSELARYS